MTPTESENVSDVDTLEESGAENRWCWFSLWVLLLTECSEFLSGQLWKQQIAVNTRGGTPGNLDRNSDEAAKFDVEVYVLERLHIMWMFLDFWLAACNCCRYSPQSWIQKKKMKEKEERVLEGLYNKQFDKGVERQFKELKTWCSWSITTITVSKMNVLVES